MPESAELGKLIELLHQAEELEQCLLNAYLYAACSLKTTPQEFALTNGQENGRGSRQSHTGPLDAKLVPKAD